MKYNIDVNQVRGQFIIQAQGDLDAKEETHIFADIIAHPKWTAQFNILFDHRHCYWGHLSINEIRNRAYLMSEWSQNFDHRKIAIVLSGDLDFGLGRMLEAYTFEKLNGSMHIFKNIDEAESWLD